VSVILLQGLTKTHYTPGKDDVFSNFEEGKKEEIK
jgi:hypothetical protein